MLLRQCIERSTSGLAFAAGLLSAHLAAAQAPPGPEQPWAIPESAIHRAEALGNTGFAVPQKKYDLAALVDLAERTNPKTREAWEAAREAAAGIGRRYSPGHRLPMPSSRRFSERIYSF
jgi:outer membrane protein TolC